MATTNPTVLQMVNSEGTVLIPQSTVSVSGQPGTTQCFIPMVDQTTGSVIPVTMTPVTSVTPVVAKCAAPQGAPQPSAK